MIERLEDSLAAMTENMTSTLKRIETRLESLEAQAAFVSLCINDIYKECKFLSLWSVDFKNRADLLINITTRQFCA